MRWILGLTAMVVAGCSESRPDPRGVANDETLLSVSATGQAETRPDMASFVVGVETIRPTSREASAANAATMDRLVAALSAQGVTDKDIQTRNLSIARIEYGRNRGQFSANNQVTVRVRNVDKASAAIGAATEAGANVLEGPTLGLSNPEKARLSAYGNAYRAARARADAYANAAEMRVSRVLVIRDGGGGYSGPMPQDAMMAEQTAAPPPVLAGPPVRIGTDIDTVAVRVDFALEAK
jgi:uncharacterized protein